MIAEQYYKKIGSILGRILETQKNEMEQAAEIIQRTLEQDGMIYIFGCGHSHIVAEDSFYRAGGLACVSAIFDEDLMLHNGAAKSSKMERMEGLAEPILDRYCLGKKDTLILVTTSGLNSVPIEAALYAKEKGIPVIGITSSAYFSEKSRHSSKKLFYEAVGFYLDNCVPKGDAVISMQSGDMGSISTFASSFIVQSILMEAVRRAELSGKRLPIYQSGNVAGGAEYNQNLIERYRSRVKHL